MRWNTAAYDTQHAFVTAYGEAVLDLLAPQPGERILDVGCGTGHLTKQIASSGAEVVGLDAAPEMIDAARAAYPDLTWWLADAATFEVEAPFDAVFSNAALHWVTDQDGAFASIARALKPGGRLVFEMGGSGNIAAITTALQAVIRERYGVEAVEPNVYPSIGEQAARLERYGFEVQAAWLIDRPTPLADGEAGMADWIRQFRQKLLVVVPVSEHEAVIAATCERLRPTRWCDGTWYADYRRLRMKAVRLT